MPSHSPSNHRCWYPDSHLIVLSSSSSLKIGTREEWRRREGSENWRGRVSSCCSVEGGYLDRLTYIQRTLLLTSFVLCASAVRARVAAERLLSSTCISVSLTLAFSYLHWVVYQVGKDVLYIYAASCSKP